MQYAEIVSEETKQKNHWNFLKTFAQNIHCGYTLELPCRDGSNEYPQCMFWIKNKKIKYIKNKKIKYIPANPSFSI